MQTLLQDIRYGMRTLSKSPGFTAIVILTLAFGIGANTAIFSVVNAVLLAPLPYNDPGSLVMVWSTNLAKGYKIAPVSGGEYAEWKSQNGVFQNIAASSDALYTLTGAGEPQVVIGYQFSADYFRLLGTRPEVGRTFLDEEDRVGGPDVVVLGDAIWRRTFGADPNIVGKSITLTGKPFTVVGVMPPSFRYPSLVELWTPLGLPASFLTNYDETGLRVLARLKPGVTLKQAQSHMNAIQQRIAQEHPQTDGGNGVNLIPLSEQIAGDVKMPLLILLGAVGLNVVLEDLPELLRIGAVDGELDALLEEGILDGLGHLLEGEQALPPGALGELDHLGDGLVGRLRLGLQGLGDHSARPRRVLHEAGGHGHAEGAPEDEEHGRRRDEGARLAALHDHRPEDAEQRDADTGDGSRIHVRTPSSRRSRAATRRSARADRT